MSALRLSILITSLLAISGCSFIPKLWGDDVKPVVIEKKAVERTPLNIKDPTPLKARELNWIVVTPDNVEEVWKKLADGKDDLVLFAITDNGYEQLSLNMAEIRNYIASQRQIIIKYKEYYEPTKKDEKKDGN